MSVPQAQLQDRIEGATWPDTVLTLTADNAAIANLASYVWTIEANVAGALTATPLWTSGPTFTASSTGVSIAWTSADMGALTATGEYSVAYVFKLTGTYQAKTLKYRLLQIIWPQ